MYQWVDSFDSFADLSPLLKMKKLLSLSRKKKRFEFPVKSVVQIIIVFFFSSSESLFRLVCCNSGCGAFRCCRRLTLLESIIQTFMYIGVNYSQEVWHAYWSIKKCTLHRPQKKNYFFISLMNQEPWQTAGTQDFPFVTCEFTRCRSPAVGRLLAALQGFAHVFYTANSLS